MGEGYRTATFAGTEYTSPGCFVARYDNSGAEPWARALPISGTRCRVLGVGVGPEDELYAAAVFSEDITIGTDELTTESRSTAIMRIIPE